MGTCAGAIVTTIGCPRKLLKKISIGMSVPIYILVSEITAMLRFCDALEPAMMVHADRVL